MTLISDDVLLERLGRSFTTEEANRVDGVIADVSASVQLYTGQLFTRAEYVWRTRVTRPYVRLPQRPVHEVTTVANIDGDDLTFTWDGLDRVYVGGCGVPNGWETDLLSSPTVVDITYEAGPDTVPPAIVGVVAGIALRTLGLAPTDTSHQQESVDGYAFTIGSAGGAGAYGVLRDEMRVLNFFRRSIGSIQVAM